MTAFDIGCNSCFFAFLMYRASSAHSARDAAALFLANWKTFDHSQGRAATLAAKSVSRNCPSRSTNRSIDGMTKSLSSEIAFTAMNRNPSRLRSPRYRGRFHINRLRAVRLGQLRLLLYARDGCDTDQYAPSHPSFNAAAIPNVNHAARREDLAHLQCRDQAPPQIPPITQPPAHKARLQLR